MKSGSCCGSIPTREELDRGRPRRHSDERDRHRHPDRRVRCAGAGAGGRARSRLVAEVALSDPTVPFVMACARLDNLASQGAFAKAGFRKDREFDDVPNGLHVLMVRHRQEGQVACGPPRLSLPGPLLCRTPHARAVEIGDSSPDCLPIWKSGTVHQIVSRSGDLSPFSPFFNRDRARRTNMKKVCIVGASGKLGQYMVQHALDRGYEVVGVCRERSVGKLDAFKGRITVIPGPRTTATSSGRRSRGATGSSPCWCPGESSSTRRERPRRCSTTRGPGRAWSSPAAGTSRGTARTSTRGFKAWRSSSRWWGG